MKIAIFLGVLIGAQAFANNKSNAQLKFVSTQDIKVEANSVSTLVFRDLSLGSDGFKSSSNCYLLHDAFPIDREISNGTEFYTDSLQVSRTVLTEKDQMESFREDLTDIGGIWEGEIETSEGTKWISAPKTLAELKQRVEEKGGNISTFKYASTIDLVINDSTDRIVQLSCQSSDYLTVGQIIKAIQNEDFDEINAIKLDTSF